MGSRRTKSNLSASELLTRRSYTSDPTTASPWHRTTLPVSVPIMRSFPSDNYIISYLLLPRSEQVGPAGVGSAVPFSVALHGAVSLEWHSR